MVGLCQSSEDGIRLIRAQNFPSKAYGGLKKITEEFVKDTRPIKAACFSVASPVIAGSTVATNLPWQISETSLKRFLSIRNVPPINDLMANAHGIEVMRKKDFSVLNAGRKKSATGRSCLLAPTSAQRYCSGTASDTSLPRRKAAMLNLVRRAAWNWAYFDIFSNGLAT